jgi:hypothetical protein
LADNIQDRQAKLQEARLGIHWNAGLMRWKPHTDKNGRTYPLHHLHPFRHEITLPAQRGMPGVDLTIYVGFGMHCFTRRTDETSCPHDRYEDAREFRTFDPQRYLLSHHLPDIARTVQHRRCAFARDENFVTLDVQSQEGQSLRYAVFFNLKRWSRHGPRAILMVIQSAYSLDEGKTSPARGCIGFNALLGHTLRGTKPKLPT